MTIPKRDKRRRRVAKALASPPQDKMVRVAPTRKCPQDGTVTFSMYCPQCGRTTQFNK